MKFTQELNIYRYFIYFFIFLSFISLLLGVFYALGSIGHSPAAGVAVYFLEKEVRVEPQLDCLQVNDWGARSLRSEFFLMGCSNSISVNDQPLEKDITYPLFRGTETISVTINNLIVEANFSNNYTLYIPFEYEGNFYTINIPVYEKNLNILWVFLSIPILLLTLLIFVYFLKGGKIVLKKYSSISGIVALLFSIFSLIPFLILLTAIPAFLCGVYSLLRYYDRLGFYSLLLLFIAFILQIIFGIVVSIF